MNYSVTIGELSYSVSIDEIIHSVTITDDILGVTVDELAFDVSVIESAYDVSIDEPQFSVTIEEIIYQVTLEAGGGTTVIGGGAVPEYINLQATGLAEGDRHLTGPGQWDTSKMIVKEIRIWTASIDWELWILQNDNGLGMDNATVSAVQLMGAGNGNELIFVDRPYQDEDATNEIHLTFLDNAGSDTFDVSVVGTELA